MLERFTPSPIFRLRGGIGNQLFIYSAGHVLSRKIKTTPTYETSGISHGDSIQDLPIQGKFLGQYRGKLLRVGYKGRFQFSPRDKLDFSWQNLVTDIPRNSLVSGYFQDSSYPVSLKNNGFFEEFLYSRKTTEFEKIYEEISLANATLLHLRFGDYRKATGTLGNLSQNYYLNAISQFSIIADNSIYILSDEPEKAKIFLKDFRAFDIRYIQRDARISNFDYLRLFGAARRIVIANSTFSWWGAFLSLNADLILAPKPWYRNALTQAPILETFYPSNFTTLQSEWNLK